MNVAYQQQSEVPPGSVPQQPPRQEPPARSAYYSVPDRRRKSPLVAGFLSLMPGLGQVYVGYYQQGFIHILVVASTIAVLNSGIGALEPLAGFFVAFFWLFNVIDAVRRANTYNEALSGLGPMEIPEEQYFFSEKGSVWGGVILIVLGAVAMSHTVFEVPLDWLEDWWPVALILVGGGLLYQSFRKKSADWGGRVPENEP